MIITTFLSLISVINPLGTVPIFLGLTNGQDSSEVKKTALKASFICMLILLSAYFLGTYILSFFNITIMSLKISGGIIIITSGLALLSGKFSKHKGINKRVKNDAFTKDAPSFTPLAIPMLAGPGSMSYLISLKSQSHNIFLDLKASFVILLA
ncbi:MAG: multiple antibiotic resistance protein, partial [Thermoproteota archaeon]